jgi:hypothetical protein
MSSPSPASGLHISVRPKPSFSLVLLPPQHYRTPRVRGALSRIHPLHLLHYLLSRAHQNLRQHHPSMRNRLALRSSSRVFAGQTSVGLTIGLRNSTTLRAGFSPSVNRFGGCVYKSCVAFVGKKCLGMQPQNCSMVGKEPLTGERGRKRTVSIPDRPTRVWLKPCTPPCRARCWHRQLLPD